MRYIPVPTGNSPSSDMSRSITSVYPCTYRELPCCCQLCLALSGISLYLQGTLFSCFCNSTQPRYIPVPTGNSRRFWRGAKQKTVYPCTYRELLFVDSSDSSERGISLYLQGTLMHPNFRLLILRYIPVPTGNSAKSVIIARWNTVYPCTYRELNDPNFKL